MFFTYVITKNEHCLQVKLQEGKKKYFFTVRPCPTIYITETSPLQKNQTYLHLLILNDDVGIYIFCQRELKIITEIK